MEFTYKFSVVYIPEIRCRIFSFFIIHYNPIYHTTTHILIWHKNIAIKKRTVPVVKLSTCI